MEIELADQHVYELDKRLTVEEIRQRAMDRRTGAFGSGLGNLLQRPKPDDIELIASQRRLEPFWHVACQARYVYERSRDYTVPASGPEVRQVTVLGQEYTIDSAGGRGSSPCRRSNTAATSSARSCTSMASAERRCRCDGHRRRAATRGERPGRPRRGRYRRRATGAARLLRRPPAAGLDDEARPGRQRSPRSR